MGKKKNLMCMGHKQGGGGGGGGGGEGGGRELTSRIQISNM